MNSNGKIWIQCAGFVAMAFCATTALAQADATASPEVGEKPQVEKTIVAPAPETPAAVSDTAPTTTLAAPEDEPADGAKKSIDQRVDTSKNLAPIKVEPRPKKNVQRIDNLPNKPKVVPKAVIKGPVAPWGYSARYSSGQVTRPSAKDLQGKTNQPGIAGQAGSPGGAPPSLGFRGSGRGKRDD